MSAGFRYKPYERLENPSGSAAPSTANTRLEETGPRPIDIAWLAGLLDGEGCFTSCPSGSPSIGVDSISRGIIEKVYEVCGGTCSCVSRKTRSNHFVYRWRVYGKNAISVAELTAPYLREKGKQAIVLSQLLRYPPHSAMRKALVGRLRSLKKADT